MGVSHFGDRVRVHYVQTFEDGSVRSSRSSGVPLELTVGTDHHRLPGVGVALVGLTEGQATTIEVPAGHTFAAADPARVTRVSRTRFAAGAGLEPGSRTRMRLSGQRSRMVRIVEVHERLVVVDLNHPLSGQSVRLEIELLAILETTERVDHWGA